MEFYDIRQEIGLQWTSHIIYYGMLPHGEFLFHIMMNAASGLLLSALSFSLYLQEMTSVHLHFCLRHICVVIKHAIPQEAVYCCRTRYFKQAALEIMIV